jgi:hypothetical protein
MSDRDIEHQIRILQGIPGSDFPSDEPEERTWAWLLYPIGVLCFSIILFAFGCIAVKAYLALDAVFG